MDNHKANYGPYKDLYVRVIKTARAKFKASVRLQRHNKASLFTITLCSVGLLVVPLAQAFGVALRYEQNIVNLVQALSAIVILVASSILTMANFAVRSERFNNAGQELHALARKLYPKRNDTAVDVDYEELADEYHATLRGCENHNLTDFCICQLEMFEYFSPSRWFTVRAYARYTAEFMPYIVIAGLEIIWLYLLFRGGP